MSQTRPILQVKLVRLAALSVSRNPNPNSDAPASINWGPVDSQEVPPKGDTADLGGAEDPAPPLAGVPMEGGLQQGFSTPASRRLPAPGMTAWRK